MTLQATATVVGCHRVPVKHPVESQATVYVHRTACVLPSACTTGRMPRSRPPHAGSGDRDRRGKVGTGIDRLVGAGTAMVTLHQLLDDPHRASTRAAWLVTVVDLDRWTVCEHGVLRSVSVCRFAAAAAGVSVAEKAQ